MDRHLREALRDAHVEAERDGDDEVDGGNAQETSAHGILPQVEWILSPTAVAANAAGGTIARPTPSIACRRPLDPLARPMLRARHEASRRTPPDPRRGSRQQREPRHGAARGGGGGARPRRHFRAPRHGDQHRRRSCVFAATMLLVYAASALYHAIPHGAPKRFFRKLDQGAIFLFIAGSYTPFAAGAARGPVGMDAVRARLGAGRGRRHAEGARPDGAPVPVDGTLSREWAGSS